MKRTLLLFSIAFLLSLNLSAQVNFTSSDLPIVVINTNGQEIPDEPKIPAEMGIIYNGPGQINHLTDPFNEYNGRIGIERRGSTSQFLSDKKPYAVETRDANNESINVSILGLPSENDWVFLAPFSDKSLMRDVLTYTLARRIMPYASRSRYVEVVLNGNYQGVYAILERIKRDNNRVDIATLNPDENSGDDLTGGYILKIDKFEGVFNDGFPSNFSPPGNPDGEIFFQYHYPRPDNISGPQKAYIQQFMHNFEQVMASDNYTHPQNGYPPLIDAGTFVDFFIINEITRNVDGYRLSTYFYKDKDSNDPRLKMGPVWDFNIALGNADYCAAWMTSGWAVDFNSVCPGDYWLIPFWWNRLREDPAFLQQVKTRWQQLRSGLFTNQEINATIDSLAGVVAQSQVRNFQRWPILGTWVWPNAYVGDTYQQEVDYLKLWLSNRLAWLDEAIDQLSTGTDEAAGHFAVSVYPNPAGERPVVFEFFLQTAGNLNLTLHDGAGRLIDRITVNAATGRNRIEWQGKTPPGMYFYQLWLDGKRIHAGKVAI
jgi:hypothetical protein